MNTADRLALAYIVGKCGAKAVLDEVRRQEREFAAVVSALPTSDHEVVKEQLDEEYCSHPPTSDDKVGSTRLSVTELARMGLR